MVREVALYKIPRVLERARIVSADVLPAYIEAIAHLNEKAKATLYSENKLSVVGDDGDATCSIQLTVSDKPLPTCTILVDKAAYRVGDLIVARWTTTNATSAAWGKAPQGQTTFTLPTSALTLTGGQGIVASLIGTVPLTMSVTGQGGTNTCTVPVIVVQ